MKGFDSASEAQDLIDCLLQVVGVLATLEAQRVALRRKRKHELVVLEGARLGVSVHIQPGTSLDASKLIHDFRPGASDHLDLP